MNIIKEAIAELEKSFKEPGEKLKSSNDVKTYCRLQLGAEKEEIFAVIFLDSHLKLIAFEKLFNGTVNECQVYFRPIAKKILEHNAAKIIIVHNHPSGTVKPSDADIIMTRDLSKFCKMLNTELIDHVIVSPLLSYSMAEGGIVIN